MRITLTGATGFLGNGVCELLRQQGHELRILSRTPRAGAGFYPWNPAEPPPSAALEGAEALIHLAGEPVAQRWTDNARQKIRISRVDATHRLVQALSTLSPRPEVLISASAVGYYGTRGDEILTETSSPGTGFLPEVCVDWERASDLALSLGIRVVKLRLGVVLGSDGGALKQMLPPFKAGLGGPLAGGRQWMSWIHRRDVAELISWSLREPSMRGAINATAPCPVTNAEFTRVLARTIHRPAIFPVPAFALRALFGEMSSILTGSQRVLPAAAEAAGFRFLHRELAGALADLL